MQRQSKFARGESRSGRSRRSRGAGTVPPLAEVARRFAQFRSQHPRGARVPGDLRAAALAALEGGVTPAELGRFCGVAWSQIVAWRAAGRRLAPVSRRAKEVPEVRAFAVVEEEATSRPPPVGPSAEDELELRLGPWSLTLRLSGPQRARE